MSVQSPQGNPGSAYTMGARGVKGLAAKKPAELDALGRPAGLRISLGGLAFFLTTRFNLGSRRPSPDQAPEEASRAK